MTLLRISFGLALGLFVACSPAQADWPQWRGPDGTGVAPDSKTVAEFDLASGKNVRWSTQMPGPSAGTPAVVGDRVFAPAGDMDNFRMLACGLDRKTGEILWKDDVGPARKSRERSRENNHAECSPVADDKHVYFFFGSGDLVCYDHEGNRKWHVNIVEKYGNIEILWGYASSPLLMDGKLYIQVLRRKPDSFLLCVDAADGNILWKQDRPSNARAESLEAYTSPIAVTLEGQKQVVVYGGDALTAHDPATGKELWRYDSDLNPQDSPMFRVISGPTQGHNGLIYFTSPRGEDLLAVEVKGNTPKLKWFKQKVRADVPCPVYYKGAVFVLSGGKKTIYKLNAQTGEEIWSQRLESSSYMRCTPTVAGGYVYLIDAEGDVLVLSAGDTFKQQAQTKLGGYPTRATIAASGDALYIRTGDRLTCVGP